MNEFPKYLHGSAGAFVIVENEGEQAAALEAGYSLEPVADRIAELEAQAESLGLLEPVKAKRGRPRKAE